jgi:hypothetical protein
VVREILSHLSEPTSLLRPTPVRGPPLREMPGAGLGTIKPQTQPAPGYELDIRR